MNLSKKEIGSLVLGAFIGILVRAAFAAAGVGLIFHQLMEEFGVPSENKLWLKIGLLVGALGQLFFLLGGKALEEKDIPREDEPRQCTRLMKIASDHPVGALQASCGFFKSPRHEHSLEWPQRFSEDDEHLTQRAYDQL